MAHTNTAPLSEKGDDTFCLHLLVSRPNGAQLLAIPLIKGLSTADMYRAATAGFYSNPDDVHAVAAIKDALDAALREASSE